MKVTTFLYKAGKKLWAVFPFRRQAALMLKRFHFPVGKFYVDLWFRGSFYIQYFDKNFQLVSSREDKGTLEIFWKGLDKCWDAISIKVWGELAKDASVVLDIGANMGLYSIAAKAVNPQCKVYAFEPSRKIVEKLKDNISANNYNDIVVASIALSNMIGEAEFYDLDVFTAIASLKPNENIMTNAAVITYKVPVTTLTEYVEENKIEQIDLISIDTEMNEPEVLEGMGSLIETFRPNFIIEVMNNEIGSKIEKYFDNFDYLYYAINEEVGLTKSLHLNRDASTATPSKSFNFLVCTRTAAEKLRLVK